MSIDRTSPLKPVSTVQPRETTDAPVTNTERQNNSLHQHQCDVKRRASKLMQPGSSDINLERVEVLKLAIRNGELKWTPAKLPMR
ncbi:anti-sigma-28 factor FlgM [Escherichia coli]|nr:anti-sigma-28 factor FlgM [Escherichia coli]